jgi:16S rRNA (guanine527-N7)-methyltransferase
VNGSVFRELLNAAAAQVRLTVPPQQVDQLETYFDHLQRWNRTINLTALPLDPPNTEAINRLFVEPLAAARFLGSRRPPIPKPQSPIPVWIDLGSGNGSPAIPMKIALPEFDLTMVESRSRKAAFLSETVRALNLDRSRVENLRFENLQPKGLADLITSRAVRTEAFRESIIQRLLRPRGWLILFGASEDLGGPFELVETVQLIQDEPGSRLQISAYVPRGTNPLTSI